MIAIHRIAEGSSHSRAITGNSQRHRALTPPLLCRLVLEHRLHPLRPHGLHGRHWAVALGDKVIFLVARRRDTGVRGRNRRGLLAGNITVVSNSRLYRNQADAGYGQSKSNTKWTRMRAGLANAYRFGLGVMVRTLGLLRPSDSMQRR